MADVIEAPRVQVPSPREIEHGEVEPYEYRPAVTAELPPRVPLGRRLAGALADMRPRNVTAGRPALPVILIAVLAGMQSLDGQSLGVLLPDLQDRWNLSLAFAATILFGVGTISYVVGPLVGYIADRAPKVTLLFVAYVVRWGVGGVLTALAPGVGVFMITRFVGAGVGQGVVGPLQGALLPERYAPTSVQRIFTFVAIGTGVGFALGPITGGYLDSSIGPLATLGVFGVIGTGVALLWPLARNRSRDQRDMAQQPKEPPLSWSESWRALSGIRSMRRLWVAVIFMTASGFGVLGFLNGYYANVFSLGPVQRGYLSALSALGAVIGLVFYGPIAERVSRDRPGGVMTLLAALVSAEAVALFGIALSPSPILSALLGMVPALSFFLFLPAMQATVAEIAPPRIIGMAQGVWPLFLLVGFSVVIPTLGWATAQFGAQAGIAAFVPFSLIAAFVFTTVRPLLDRDARTARANALAAEAAKQPSGAARAKLVVCRGVEVVYDGVQVLFGVDLDIEQGELLALIGTNGAGKSTLLRAISGMQAPSGGAVFLDAEDITHTPAHIVASRGVVMMPGGRAVFPSLTVRENLRAATWLHRGADAEVKADTERVLHLFPRLVERMDTRAGDLSGGEQQMLALGQALILEPRLLLIDELSLGLAPQVVESLLEMLRQINRIGTTVVVVEQSIAVALEIAQRVVYMERGTVRFDGPPRDLLRRGDVVHSVFLGGASGSSLAARRVQRWDQEAHEHALDVRDVTLDYGGAHVLGGVSFTVAPGEVVGLIGPNGAGKTSLFDVITGFAPEARGTILLGGVDVTTMSPDARARLGLVRSYQNVRLFPALTVRENIEVALSRHLGTASVFGAALWLPPVRRMERRMNRRVDNLIESLGLGRYANSFVNELSTGTRRIADIACMLATEPRVLLLDEPSSGLAQAETENLAPLIGRIVKDAGCGLVIIEHDIGLVAAVSDRIVALRLGCVMKEGSPAKVLDDPEVIEALLGGASHAVLARSIAVDSVHIGQPN